MYKSNPLDFFDKYELIGSIDLYKPSKDHKCRFCRDLNSEQFQNKPHLIPELLGKNNYLSLDECDICNAFFSKYESHLAKFASPFLAITGTETKKKIPTYQSRSDTFNQNRTTLQVNAIDKKRHIFSNDKDVRIDYENREVELKLRNPGVKLNKVYRALCKTALGVMPPELIEFNNDYFDWIMGIKELPEIGHGFQTILYSKYFTEPTTCLYQAKNLIVDNNEYLEFIGITCFANTVIQFHLPLSERFIKIHNSQKKLELVIFPAIGHDGKMNHGQKVKLNHFNFTDKNVFEQDVKFNFNFRK